MNIHIYGDDFHKETIYKWFTDFCFFKPTKMRTYHKGQLFAKRYSEAALKESVLSEKTSFVGLYNTKRGFMEASFCHSSSFFIIKLPYTLWIQNKAAIIDKYQKLFVEFGGCFGFVVNSFDYDIIQNPCDANVYNVYKLGDTDFAGINSIPIIQRDLSLPYPLYQIDPSYLPGHAEWYDKLVFTTAPYMWFGPDFYKFFSKEKLSNFENCQENIEFSTGYRRICLWENIAEYNNALYRQRQWDFRDVVAMDRVIEALHAKPFIYKRSEIVQDPTIEFESGKFPHGGTLISRLYVDSNGKKCSKSAADAYILREISGHTVVFEKKVKL